MIVFDTETTGLVQSGVRSLAEQPEIVEFAAVKLDAVSLEETAQIAFLCKPRNPIPAETTAIHGITDADVADKAAFGEHYADLCNFFLGETAMAAHYVVFDTDMLKFELMRLGKVLQFPWPMKHICTRELSGRIEGANGKQLRLRELHRLATGKEHEGEHRALADVRAVATCIRFLRRCHSLI